MSKRPNLPPVETSMTPDHTDSRPSEIRDAKANPLSNIPTCPPQTPRRRRPMRLDTVDTPTATLFATPARRPRAIRQTHQAIDSEDTSTPIDPNTRNGVTDSNFPDEPEDQPQPRQADGSRPFCTPARRPPRRPQCITYETSDGEEDSTIVVCGGHTYTSDTQSAAQPEVIYKNQPHDDDHARSIDARLEIQLAWAEIAAAESNIEIQTLELEKERADLEKEKAALAEERSRLDQVISSMEDRVASMLNIAAAQGVREASIAQPLCSGAFRSQRIISSIATHISHP